MERITVPKEVLAELAKDKKETERIVYTADEIADCTNLCRHHGVATGIKAYNRKHPGRQVSYSSAQRWVESFKQKLTHYTPLKRGKSCLLPKALEDEVIDVFKKTRDLSEQCDSQLICSITRGLVRKAKLSATLASEGGVDAFSDFWARSFLHRHKIGVFAPTTTRTASAKSIVEAASGFYRDIARVGSAPEDTYNMDEFFALLSGTTRKWTWHFAREKAQVPLRERKLGFTSSILTSADGEAHLLQMIWKGKTARSAARNEGEDDPMIMQQTQPDSHFQTAETFREWFMRFVEIARARALPRGNVPICLILDAARQHHFDEMEEICMENNIAIVGIPPGLTHAFQPADQFIISGLKAKVHSAWNKFVEGLFATHDVDSAIGIMFSSSATAVKKLKYKLFSEALHSLPPGQVLASWAMTGIPRTVWNIPPTCIPIIDIMSAKAEQLFEVYVVDDTTEDDHGEVDEDEEFERFIASLVPPAAEPPRQVARVEEPAAAPKKAVGRPKKIAPPPPQPAGKGPLDGWLKKKGGETQT